MKNTASGVSRRAVACLIGSNALVYGLNSVYSAFMPVYLSAHHSSIVKGYLLAVGSVVSLFAPVMIGKMADKAASKSRVLAAAVALSAVFFAAFYLSANAWYLALLMVLLTFCRSSFGGMIDTATLEYTAVHDAPYGPFRMMGTIGYGLIALGLGFVANDHLGYVFASYPILAAAAILALLAGPQVPGHAAKKEKLQLAPTLKNRNICVLFLLNGAVYFSFFYYQHFYNEYMLDMLHLSTELWGLNILTTAALEIPFFLLFDRIMRKVRLKTMLLVCMAVSVARYLLLPTVTTASGILLTGIFTGAWVTVVTYCATFYIQKNMPPHLIASSIGLLYGLSCGVGMSLADLAGGYLTAGLGIRGGLFFCSAVCLLALPTIFLLRPSARQVPQKT